MKKIIILSIALIELSYAGWLYNEDYDKCVRTPSYYHGIEASRKEVSKYPACKATTVLEQVYPKVSIQNQKMAYGGNGDYYPTWMWYLGSQMFICDTKKNEITFFFFGSEQQCESMRRFVHKMQ